MTTLNDFYDMLERADWTYQYSDDHSVWKRGSASMANLEAIAKESPEHQAMFDGFKTHVFSGDPWGTEEAPKPERPI